MTLLWKVVKHAAVGVGLAETPKGLSVIHRPGCAAAIWRRRTLPNFLPRIDGLYPDASPAARVTLRPDSVRVAVKECFGAPGTPSGSDLDRLVDDITAISDIFAGLMRARWLRLRLDVLTTNACRKFHIDAVTARLICTCRGTGTQYGISTDGAKPRRVFTVPTGAPIVLRGTLWPWSPRSGLLHCSPPVEGSNVPRLVLVLDALHDPEDAA